MDAARSGTRFGEWAKAASFLIVVIAAGSAVVVFLHSLIFPPPSQSAFSPQQTAVYLCRTKFEREIPNAFLTASPVSTAAPNGFDIAINGTSAGLPKTAACTVRGNQVLGFDVR